MLQIASLAAIFTGFKCTRAILPYLRSPFVPPQDKYVMITGCTDGIGKEYAKYMGERKVPLILIGRNQSKLENLVKQLTDGGKRQLQHKIMVADYSDINMDWKNFNQAFAKLQIPQKSVCGVINCSGTAFITKFNELPWQQIQKTKQVNTISLQLTLKMLTAPLISPNPFLINLSSYTSTYPLKYSSVYSASKAYMSNLLAAYGQENKHVKVLSVQPWYVNTKMTGFRKGWDCVRAQDVVEGSLRVLGSRKACTGTIKHQLIREFGLPLEIFYFPKKIEENFERVQKLRQLQLKRKLKKAQPEPKK